MKIKINQKAYYLIIGLFALISFISIVLIVNQTNLLKNRQIIPTFKPQGAFTIEGNSEVGASGSFQIQVIADSDNRPANAIALFIKFDPQKIKVINLDTSSSFCQFYPENKFDNDQGTISIQCGSPSPGFKGKDNIASIQFMPQTIGQTNIEILDTSLILLNDGKGENILSRGLIHPITILNTI